MDTWIFNRHLRLLDGPAIDDNAPVSHASSSWSLRKAPSATNPTAQRLQPPIGHWALRSYPPHGQAINHIMIFEKITELSNWGYS